MSGMLQVVCPDNYLWTNVYFSKYAATMTSPPSLILFSVLSSPGFFSLHEALHLVSRCTIFCRGQRPSGPAELVHMKHL